MHEVLLKSALEKGLAVFERRGLSVELPRGLVALEEALLEVLLLLLKRLELSNSGLQPPNLIL